jgi:sortase (surface protein transpeptidase)
MLRWIGRRVAFAILAILSSIVLGQPLEARQLGPAWSDDRSVVELVLPSDPRLQVATTTRLEPKVVESVTGLRIEIPRLGIDLPLEPGDASRDVPRTGFAGATPENVALLFPGTSIPGNSGNSYIYAHARSGMFISLWSVRLGDVVIVVRPDGSTLKRYQVALIVARVDPADTRWLDTAGPERLTLQTSTGPRPEDPRFIAVAYPLEN